MMVLHAVLRELPERFLEKIRFEPCGCWVWTGARNGSTRDQSWRGGYGYIWFEGRAQRAHRVVYELLRGPIPEGLVLDHQCDNRPCVNPWHQAPCTSGENSRRALTKRAP